MACRVPVRPGNTMNPNLRMMDFSLGNSRGMDLGNTFRREGMSLNRKQLRFHRQEVDMEVTLDELEIGRRIGAGACSNVHLATHVHTNVPYAVKFFSVYDEAQADQLLREVTMLFAVQDCDALMTLKGAFHDEGRIGIILEFMDNGALDFLMKCRCSEHVFAAIFYQILWGLGYLHYESKLHRDVKPANVLVNSDGYVKLSDFGISRSLDGSQAMSNSAVGTFRYMSPERLNNSYYHHGGDIWSVGVMMLELWLKRYPFESAGNNPIELIQEFENLNVTHLLESLGGSMSRTLKEVIWTMLAHEPNDRSTCAELIGFEWFTENRIDNLEVAHEIVSDWLRTRGSGSRGSSHRAEGKEDRHYDDDYKGSGRGK